ncbi:unnamed protein product, partial [Mesorhabditis spiculigera]
MWTIAIEGGPRRVNHAAVELHGFIWSFGGYCSGERQSRDRPIDIHVLNPANYRWTPIEAQNEELLVPKERAIGPMSFEQEVFERAGLAMLGDGEWDGEGPPILQSTLPAHVPYPRYGHTVCAFGGKAYLWGGRNDDYGASHLLHQFDPETLKWTLVSTSGYPPPARDGHTAVVSGHRMYVFGGFEEELQRFSQDTYSFDFLTKTWSKLTTSGHPPIWRDFHTAVAINDKMYIYGGRRVYENKMFVFGGYQGTLNKHFNDLYSYDPESGVWAMLRPAGQFPCERRRQCTVVVDDKVYLFGGTMPVGVTIDNSATGLADLDDLHVFDFKPTLRTLCLLKVCTLRDTPEFKLLPRELRKDCENVCRANEVAMSTVDGWFRQLPAG